MRRTNLQTALYAIRHITQFFFIVESYKLQSELEKSKSGISNMWEKFVPMHRQPGVSG